MRQTLARWMVGGLACVCLLAASPRAAQGSLAFATARRETLLVEGNTCIMKLLGPQAGRSARQKQLPMLELDGGTATAEQYRTMVQDAQVYLYDGAQDAFSSVRLSAQDAAAYLSLEASGSGIRVEATGQSAVLRVVLPWQGAQVELIVLVPGDVDLNGRLNGEDAQKVTDYLVMAEELDAHSVTLNGVPLELERLMADVTGDDLQAEAQVNTLDLVWLQARLAGANA